MIKNEDVPRVDLPRIETDRLILRTFQDCDLDATFELFNDRAVQKYLSPRNRRTREQMKTTLRFFRQRWHERGFGLWRVGEKATDEMIGYCGFQYFDASKEVEILFAFFERFWGKGYATESANACLRFGFEKLTLDKIFAAFHPANADSRRVLEKLGFVFRDKTEHYGIDTTTYLLERRNFQPRRGFYNLTYDKA